MLPYEYPYQNLPGNTFALIPSQVGKTTNAMTQTTDPTHQSTKTNQEQQLKIDRQLAPYPQEIEIARVNVECRHRQQQIGAGVESINVESTHTKTVENQTLVVQQNKSKRSKRPVETQFQTDVSKPRAS